MPTPTYTPLANITLGSSAASVTFSSISGLYRDLILVWNGKTTNLYENLMIRFNSDTGSNYNRVWMTGNGSAASSSSGSGEDRFYAMAWGLSNTDPSNGVIQVMDYAATDKHKSVLSRFNQSAIGVDAVAGRWASTSAITSLTVFTAASGFAAGSSLALYGIAS